MKICKKKTLWCIGIALAVLVLAVVLICNNRKFKQTTIHPDESLPCPSDTTFVVNGVAFKMVGIQGGIFRGEGLKHKATLSNFYIGETEVTRQLWCAVMGKDSHLLGEESKLPVSEVSLDDCFDFLERLNALTGVEFYLPPYEYWLYAAYSGKSDNSPMLDEFAWHASNSEGKAHPVKTKCPDASGLYDMVGNVAEWTISGPDPLFIVAGGSFKADAAKCNIDRSGINHADVRRDDIGFRLFCDL